jgi:glycosyltransferase 2 family protein
MNTRRTPWRRAGPWLRKAATWGLAVWVVVLLVQQVRRIDWGEVWQALQLQPPLGMALAAGLALMSYALVASYDLVGRHETRHGVPAGRCLRIAATCYAFNLNFGALVGAFALKLRLYATAGLKAGTVGQVIALTITTNWLGYLFVAGQVLLWAPPPLPPQFHLTQGALRTLGLALTVVALAYLGWCMTSRERRSVRLRGHEFQLPAGRVALWQLATSSANWCLMALTVWVLLQQQVPYTTVLGVLLMAAVAGVITHVPAGLGVIEAVFLACLAGQVPEGQLLAALLAYRAAYYLLPLAWATLGFALGQRTARGAAPVPDHRTLTTT